VGTGGSTDIYGASIKADGTSNWVIESGAGAAKSNTLKGNGVILDGSDLYVLASTTGDHGGTTVGSALGSSVCYVIKFKSDGTVGYVTQLGVGAATACSPQYFGIDGSHQIYFTSGTTGSPTADTCIGTCPTNAVNKVILVGLTSTGAKNFIAAINGDTVAGNFNGSGLQVDTSGNSYVIGSSIAVNAGSSIYAGTTGFQQIGTYASGYTDLAVVKFNSSGVQQWMTEISGTTSSSTLTLGSSVFNDLTALDASGNLYLLGASQWSSIGTMLGTAGSGNMDAFVTKLSAAGAHTWTTIYNTSDATTDLTSGTALLLDSSNNPVGVIREDATASGVLPDGAITNGLQIGTHSLFDALFLKFGTSAGAQQ
jgi:hypothetical protein